MRHRWLIRLAVVPGPVTTDPDDRPLHGGQLPSACPLRASAAPVAHSE
jgi:hypothetical protein